MTACVGRCQDSGPGRSSHLALARERTSVAYGCWRRTLATQDGQGRRCTVAFAQRPARCPIDAGSDRLYDAPVPRPSAVQLEQFNQWRSIARSTGDTDAGRRFERTPWLLCCHGIQRGCRTDNGTFRTIRPYIPATPIDHPAPLLPGRSDHHFIRGTRRPVEQEYLCLHKVGGIFSRIFSYGRSTRELLRISAIRTRRILSLGNPNPPTPSQWGNASPNQMAGRWIAEWPPIRPSGG